MRPLVLALALLSPSFAAAGDGDEQPVTEGVIERDNDRIIDDGREPETEADRQAKIAEAERMIREAREEQERDRRAAQTATSPATTTSAPAQNDRLRAPDGRHFKTNQDRVNYEMCQKGHSVTCSHVNYAEGGGAPSQPSGAAGASRAPRGGETRTETTRTSTDDKDDKKESKDGSPSSGGGSGGGGSSSSGGGQGGGKSAEDAQAKSAEASERAKAASAKAGAMGDQLKKFSADTLSGGPQGGPGGAAPKPSGGAPAPGGDRDLAAAAASGYAASFAATGLKMGTGAQAGRVLRADGSPATADDVARLRAQIAADPAALAKRPDFFNVVGRASVAQLKSDFHAKPDARDGVFKHVGLTEKDRDFQRTESCNPKLDKGCNTASDAAYAKGEFVSPEDLKAIEDALRADEEDEKAELARAAAGGEAAGPNSEERPAARRRRRSRPITRESALALAAERGAPGAAPERTYTPPEAADLEAERAAAAKPKANPLAKLPVRELQGAALLVIGAAWLWGRRKRSFLAGDR